MRLGGAGCDINRLIITSCRQVVEIRHLFVNQLNFFDWWKVLSLCDADDDDDDF